MNPPSQISTSIPDIKGEVLRDARESLRLTQEQLARTLCLSPKHIDQLENNGMTAFFSLKHRYQVALKVAGYLGLEPADISVQIPLLATTSSATETFVEQQPILPDLSNQLGEAIVTEPLASAPPPKGWPNRLALHRSKLVFMVLLGILIPASYLTAELVINRHPLIFPDTVTATLNELDKKVAANDVPAINPVEICDLAQFANIPAVSVESPLKKGDNVLVLAKSDQPVCVIDGVKNVSSLNLSTESKQFITGQAPFIINAPDFSGLEIYFQGRRVRYPSNWQGPIRLIEGTFKEVAN